MSNSVTLDNFLVKKKNTIKGNINDIIFEEKYRPKDIENFVGNKSVIKELREFISKVGKVKSRDAKKICILKGPSGIGKKTMVNLLLKDYNVIRFDSDNMVKKSIFMDNMNKFTDGDSIDDYFSDKKIAIVINGIDELLNAVTFKELINMLNKKTIEIPIVCTVDANNKFKYRVLKCCLIISMEYPSLDEYVDFCTNLIKCEKITIVKSTIPWIVKHSKYNFKNILHCIKILSLKKVKYTKKVILKVLKFSQSDSFLNAHDVVDSVLNNEYEEDNINENISICYTDQPLIIDLLYSNIIQSLSIDNISKSLDSICEGDIFNNYIYNNQQWEMRQYSIVSSCVNVFNIIHNNKKRKSYTVKKNQLNNVVWSEISSKNNLKLIRPKFYTTSLKPLDYSYIIKYIIIIETDGEIIDDNINDKVCLLHKMGITFPIYIKLRKNEYTNTKALVKKEKDKLEYVYKSIEN